MLETHSIAVSQPEHTEMVEIGEILPEPLALISLALLNTDAAKRRFPSYRLTRLMGARIELDELDATKLPDILGIDIHHQILGARRPFDDHLRCVISDYGLEELFSDDGYTPYHHAIRPTGYDFYRDEVVPLGMEHWRAVYRSMADERQMLAASIIWLYRAGKDNVWLRRVPCIWHAADAIECMKSKNVLTDWARLYTLYPGW